MPDRPTRAAIYARVSTPSPSASSPPTNPGDHVPQPIDTLSANLGHLLHADPATGLAVFEHGDMRRDLGIDGWRWGEDLPGRPDLARERTVWAEPSVWASVVIRARREVAAAPSCTPSSRPAGNER